VAEVARVDSKELGKESESIGSEAPENHWEKGSRETHKGREDEMMGNESKCHRRDANKYSIECRTGDESGGCSGFESLSSRKAEALIASKTARVDI
jgi:hypothetical protein